MDRLQGTKQTAGAIVCTVGIVMMGSRSAILCLALFGVLGSVRRGGLAAKAVLWTSALIVIYLVVLQTGAERMTDYEDLDRELTRDATWNAVVSNGWGAIWGTGVGGIWPWFGPTGRAVSAIWVTMDSPYGKTLFHPHSVVNLMVGEFGVPGVLYLLALLAILLKFWLRARKGSHFFLATGIVATLPLGLTETIFFKAWEMNAIWWVFLFGALRLVGSREGQRPERRSPPMHHMSGPALRVKIGSEPHPRCHQPRNTAPTEDP
jgi:hypothetical protein